MIRRIVAAATGGLAGLMLGMVIDSMLPHLGRRDTGYRLAVIAFCSIGGGWLVQTVAEKLRLVPSESAVNDKYRPPSIR